MSVDAPTTGQSLPERPRLAEHVLARLHRVDGSTIVVLFDQRRGTSYQVGLREWVLLSMADGTRDLEGVRLAGAREGSLASLEALSGFLRGLDDVGMLADGPAPDDAAPTRSSPADRPIDSLAGYLFSCDGKGVCCRQYSTIVFSQLEAARARSLLPLIERGGDRVEWAFTPRHGTTPSPACAVKHVDGACAYLDERGLCSIHAAAGAEAKPFGCNLFPARFVDDGEAVRVSPLVECACVIRSAEGSAGDPLVSPDSPTRGQLAREVFIEVLPEVLALTEEHTFARADLVSWSRAVLEARPHDLVGWLWSAADAMDRDGALPHPAGVAASVDPEAMLPWLRSLRAVLDGVIVESRGWRGPSDFVLHALEVMRETLGLLTDEGLLAPTLQAGASQPEAEAFYLRATAHAHQWIGERPFSVQLRNVAMRASLARTIHRCVNAGMLTGEAFSEPIALVEAMCRGYGVHAATPA